MVMGYDPELENAQDEAEASPSYFTAEHTEMYQLHPPPPQRDLQELITQYKTSGEAKYFLWFLHWYEPHINKISVEAATNYAVMEHWQDIKAEIVATLWEAVQRYELTCNIDFLATVKHKIDHSIHNYIRTMRSGFTVHSESEYKKLRSIIAEYQASQRNGQDINTEDMAQKRGISEKLLMEILEGALRNTTLLPQYRENDDGSEEDLRQNASDPTSDPAYIYQISERNQAIYTAFQNLSYRERLIVSSHLGFCPNCFTCRNKDGTLISKQSFYTIGIFHELKEKAVARIYNRALRKIRQDLALPSP